VSTSTAGGTALLRKRPTSWPRRPKRCCASAARRCRLRRPHPARSD